MHSNFLILFGNCVKNGLLNGKYRKIERMCFYKNRANKHHD